jgi:hypothetical protein
MHISFDSLQELDAFIQWAGRDHTAVALNPAYKGEPEVTVPDANWEAPEVAPPAEKRKRRTKAEMEAARAAEEEPSDVTDEKSADNAAVQAVLARAPAAEVLEALEQVELVEAEQAPEVVEAVAAEEPAQQVQRYGKPGPEHAQTWIQGTADGKNGLNPIEHLNACRAFIAANGMDDYQKSFELAGLSTNVLGYDEKQAAKHAAALEWLAWKE